MAEFGDAYIRRRRGTFSDYQIVVVTALTAIRFSGRLFLHPDYQDSRRF